MKKMSEELMPVACHPEKWWNACVSEEDKKEIEPIFIEKIKNVCPQYTIWGY